MTIKRVTPSEYQECRWFYQWALTQLILKDYLIKNVNEGLRTPKTGALLKAIGLRAGIPDYQLPVYNGTYHGLWIEMKKRTRRNGIKDPRQDQWIEKLQKIGHYATYAYGWDHAAQISTDYLANKL